MRPQSSSSLPFADASGHAPKGPFTFKTPQARDEWQTIMGQARYKDEEADRALEEQGKWNLTGVFSRSETALFAEKFAQMTEGLLTPMGHNFDAAARAAYIGTVVNNPDLKPAAMNDLKRLLNDIWVYDSQLAQVMNPAHGVLPTRKPCAAGRDFDHQHPPGHP